MVQKMMIDRAQRGDKSSFAFVIQQIQDESYRIANSCLLDEAASMDAVCDAVEEAVIHIQKLDNPERFNIWFNRIVIQKCKSHLLNSKLSVYIDDKEVKGLVKRQTTEENLELQAFMKQQSPMTRLLIQLKYAEGYTIEEITEMTEMPLNTIKTKIDNTTIKLFKQSRRGRM
ncbi:MULTISPECIES: RNA polymerase sigma factor [Paenibacillus]|uniref:RNA polymerase sigma factor n=1 Tax=Paenibacillus TaxID=44249 RepID=UPI000385F082|nr:MULTISPECIES: ECF subfamily RNA polymerase sigma-24 subunit [Paenibacillus]EPY13618.1 ECF subfamily RNA polymerase sigma-24 subunit [Paenibacillus alvei A6-6i-x]SDE82519.1 RNA polymerase sigma-70 factor, ECF subfamily [Paenibacillus sp. cl6col]